MSESDTNPQRLPDPDDAYQRPATQVPQTAPGGQAQPVGGFPAAGERAEAPAASEPNQPVSAQPTSALPTSALPVSGEPADQTAQLPPFRQPEQAPTSAAPMPPQGAWQAAAPGYGAPQQPYAPQPRYAQQGTPQQGYAAQPPYAPQPAQSDGPQPPADGTQPAGAAPAPRQPSGRFGKVVAGGLLALLLAGGGGVVGGLVVHATDGSTKNSALSAAPTVDRSTLSGIVNNVKNSVVSLQTQDDEGSGVIFSADGFIVTNNHVVADANNNTVQVTFADGKTTRGTVVGTDAKTDLAVVKAQNASNLTVAKFANSDAVQVGDTVLAIGSPLGLEGSVTAGIVSALHRTISEQPEQQQPQNPFQFPQQQQQQQQQQQGTNIAGAIQTDAAINPGNSGGALVNTNGDVIGINTSILTSDGGEGNIGVGFAIPSNRVNEVSQDLMKGQKVSHPFIGINVATADNGAGASVASVVSGSPADKAGLKQGDVIVKANDADIHTGDDLLDVVQSSKVGDKLQLTVSRGGSTETLAVTVGESS